MAEQNLSYILNHLGEDRDSYFQAVSPPVIQSSNFYFKTVDDLRQDISDELANRIYTRGNNPTTEILRKKLAALESAEDALVFASGIAAVAATVLAFVKQGAHIVSAGSVYSWTTRLFKEYLPRFGVETSFVDGRDLVKIEEAIRPETSILYLESPTTMLFELQDLRSCAMIARKHGLISMIDNSCCSPIYQRPIELGINLSIHSVTKFLNGHSDVVMGAVCGSKELINHIFNTEFINIGGIVSPHDAALVIRGLRTLPLRVDRSYQSALKIVEFLHQQSRVLQVNYPFHAQHPQYDLAVRQMEGQPGLFSVLFKANSINEMEDFVHRLNYFLIAVSWGGHESLVMPVCAFHGGPTGQDSPLPWNLVRFYIGLEDPELLIEDIRQAMEALPA